LATGNRVHRINGRNTGGNHFLGIFLQKGLALNVCWHNAFESWNKDILESKG
jgi:hypothetical protein